MLEQLTQTTTTNFIALNYLLFATRPILESKTNTNNLAKARENQMQAKIKCQDECKKPSKCGHAGGKKKRPANTAIVT